MFEDIIANPLVMGLIGVIIIWYFYQLTIRETYSDGGIGVYSYSSGNTGYSSRPQREQNSHYNLNFRYLNDYSNW